MFNRWPSGHRIYGDPDPRHYDNSHDKLGMFGGDYFAVIEMSESDFRGLVQRMGLVNRPDLLQYWGTALHAPKDVQIWTVSETNDADTFFGDQRRSTYLVARYESGRMYYKVHVY